MLFSSITFLYYFLPVVTALYFIAPMPRGSTAARNAVLLLASVTFYAWGEPVYVLLMLGQALSGWIFGLLIDRARGNRRLARAALLGSIIAGIGGLMFFKYTDFLIGNVNSLFGLSVGALKIALPIGISFYTFQILSYDFDLYLGKTSVQRNFFTLATYVTLFPQLIAGPIVRYVDVERELRSRSHTLADFASGARRFIVGLGKKVLIANVLGELVAVYKSSDENSALFAWLYAAAYSLHIYFDFSGYSDMAIGMGRMFGFKFLENFNYPYIADSITDFWRRWHISLSSWFRDYVYIPLGGNRVKPARHMFNILVVWFLTGFWHGAGWNFIVWGMFFAFWLLVEKFALGKLLKKLPRPVSRVYVLLCVAVSWAFFDAPDIPSAARTVTSMFAGADSLAGRESLYYLRSYAAPLIAAAIGATPLPATLIGKLGRARAGAAVLTVAEPLFLAALLVLVTAYLVDGSFNPFIYFRF
ncbi:MAG: MBOAT family protein [Oscillospiraceae bacterium]|jgi:alginate O-acetyltransferase complex protein AlgI|nr:MBOAT family protein [Oscillospiraceae bacterium]